MLVDINWRLQVVAMTLHSSLDDTTKTDCFSPLWLHWKAVRVELLGLKSEERRVKSEDLLSKVQAVGVTGLTERAEGRWLVAH